MTASNFWQSHRSSLTAIEKLLARIEGKLNFGLSIIIVLSILTLIALFWPETGVRPWTASTVSTSHDAPGDRRHFP